MVTKIVARAKEIGLSQAALERSCGLSANRISKWANGQGEPTARQLYRISRVLGCTTDFLVDDAQADPSAASALNPAARTAVAMVGALGLSEDEVIRALNAIPPTQGAETGRRPRAAGVAPSAIDAATKKGRA